MSEEFVRRVLREHAQANMTRPPDLWPALRARLQVRGGPVKEGKMGTRIGRRPLVVAGALVIVVLLAFVAATLVQPAPVSLDASQVLARAEKAGDPKTATIQTFHGVYTARFPSGTKLGVYTEGRADMWYQASPYRYLFKGTNKTPDAPDVNWFIGEDEERVYDYMTGEKYRDRPVSQFPNRPFIAIDWRRLAQGGSLGEATGTGDKQFSLFDLYDVQIAGTETMSGRQVYRLELTARPVDRTQTGARWPAYDRVTLWVDKEVFLILRVRLYNSDGTVSGDESFESAEINRPVDPAVFDFSEPTGPNR